MDNIGKAWLIIVLLVVLTRAVFAIIRKQSINPVGLLMGGFLGAIGGTAIGGIFGALLSRITANMITSVNPTVNIDFYQSTVYNGMVGAIIGTIGGATVGVIGGAWPKEIERIPKSVFVWLSHIAIILAFLIIGIGCSTVLGKVGGLAMYGASSAAMQWYILGGKLSKDDIGTLSNMIIGFIIWTVAAILLVQSLGSIVVGAIGGFTIGVGQWLVIEKKWLIIEKEIKLSIQGWALICAVLGGILGGIIELFAEYVILR